VDNRDQALNDQVNIPATQPSQEKESKARELAQIIKEITIAQTTQNLVHQLGFVSSIIQAEIGFRKL